jgi:TetR/AcrR family transcriptional regulator, fatty acid metabolism regulator protein
VASRSAIQEERRRQILDAAVRAFAEKGYHACRVSDIAEEAGVAYGLVYHYFESKDAVLEAVFREMWGRMVGVIEGIIEMEESPREQLRKTCAFVLRTWRDYPDVVRVLVREVARSGDLFYREVEEIGLAFAALQRIVENGQAQKVFREDLPPRLGAWIIYGALEEILTGWVLGRLPGDDEDVREAERAVVAVLSNGLLIESSVESGASTARPSPRA